MGYLSMERVGQMPQTLASLVDGVQMTMEGAAMAVASTPLVPWIKSRKAAIGLIFSILGAAFAAGGAVALWGSAILDLPERVTAIEVRQDATDALAHERWIVVERLLCQLRQEQTGTLPPECEWRVIR